MRILLTGHMGFIGSHTLDLLLKEGHEVVGVDDRSSGNVKNVAHIAKGSYKSVSRSIVAVNGKWLYGLFEDFQPDAIIHLAAQSALFTSEQDPLLDARVNITGTMYLVMLANEFGVDRFVFSSTSAVYREGGSAYKEQFTALAPTRPYGISKLAAEHYIQCLFEGTHVILRYGNVYGPRQVAIGDNQLIARAFSAVYRHTDFAIYGKGDQTRDFIYVSDVAKANVQALYTTSSGCYNVSTGIGTTVNEVIHHIRTHTGSVMFFKNEPARAKEPHKVMMDNNRGKAFLHWSPKVRIGDGIRETAEWWKKEH